MDGKEYTAGSASTGEAFDISTGNGSGGAPDGMPGGTPPDGNGGPGGTPPDGEPPEKPDGNGGPGGNGGQPPEKPDSGN